MSTTIRRLFRPALNLSAVAMMSVLVTFATAHSAEATTLSEPSRTSIAAVKDRAPEARRLSLGERVMQIAAAQAGDPYQYGAAGPNAFDCSGFTSFVYRTAGRPIPRTSAQQRAATPHIAASAARRGDLVFFHNSGGVYHVGIYAGEGSVWHAAGPGTGISRVRIWTSAVSYGRVN